ncbi:MULTISPECIES: Rad52/Rad22 family DNA repair protein [unclassified Spirosoma]|uniref:Rad52/Rad22 family DNA repair protein n=1 Tax=unclassified Spirosoma TaxID=2621999 RepID=UPI00095EEEE2|nr:MULTISPECIES: Rad52/Rad22 family DNA repair protein [unclassified Spirosoma]MBN8822117.1 DNA repair protein Rad52 [Spirosoma sp.]OJW80515.1 MAG: DNA repair protein Rad52 [Spirosoma sp. 48-14]
MDLSVLNAPLTVQEIEWRVQSQTKDGQKIVVVPYITNRCVMQRFDEQFGWAGWQNEIKEIDGGFLCTITVVLPGGEIVRKTDGASRTVVEPVKGGISDAMKRCAVQFGLGRSLYDFPKVLIQTTDKYIPEWAGPLLDKMVDKINSGGTVRDVVVLKPEHAKPAVKSV